jgi:ribonucleotide monophosphatase NagD (HAD superfamily)
VIDEKVFVEMQTDPSVKALVYGLDAGFTYQSMNQASLYLQNPDVYFLCLNRDRNSAGLPAGGSCLAGLE